MKKCFTRAQAREAVHKETKPYRKSNLIRATSARTISGSLLARKRELSPTTTAINPRHRREKDLWSSFSPTKENYSNLKNTDTCRIK